MVNSSTKILSLVLFLALISEGYGKCSFSNIYVRQAKTGKIVEGKFEWAAEIINNCTCPQKNVNLNCNGFHPVQPVDPRILSVIHGHLCIVKHGQPINPSIAEKIPFLYAADNLYAFIPVSSEVSCP